MKKSLCLLLVLILCAALTTSAFAAGTQNIYIEELGIGLELPDSFVTAQRGETDDAVAQSLWMDDARSLERYLLQNDTWLRAADSEGYTLLELAAFDGEGEYEEITPETFPALKDEFVEAYSEGGILKRCEYAEINGRGFAVIEADYGDENDPYDYLEMWTVEGDCCLYLYLDVYPDMISDTERELLYSIASTLSFDGEIKIARRVYELTAREGAPSMFKEESSSPNRSMHVDSGFISADDKYVGPVAAAFFCFALQLLPALAIRFVIKRRAIGAGGAVIISVITGAVCLGVLWIGELISLSAMTAAVLITAVVGYEILARERETVETWDRGNRY